jgi:hypothetical protein
MMIVNHRGIASATGYVPNRTFIRKGLDSGIERCVPDSKLSGFQSCPSPGRDATQRNPFHVEASQISSLPASTARILQSGYHRRSHQPRSDLSDPSIRAFSLRKPR